MDHAGRAVLTFLPSDPVPAWSNEALITTALLVRQLHEALADFIPPKDAVWPLPPIARRAPNGRIGHNDLCPENTVYADGLPYGFIDWDLAGPGQPLDDLASGRHQLRRSASRSLLAETRVPEAPDRIARLRLFCDAYGVNDRLALLDAIVDFQRDEVTKTVELGGRGVSPYWMLLDRGEDHYRRMELAWLAENRSTLEQALR